MGPFLAKLWCLEDVLSKTWNLLRVHSQNLQSVVTPSKMTLFVDFSLKMEIYMLSFQIKKKLKENTQKQKNGIWLKWRRNRQKSTKITPFHLRGCPGGLKWDFCRFRLHFDQMPFFCFWVFSCKFCFKR